MSTPNTSDRKQGQQGRDNAIYQPGALVRVKTDNIGTANLDAVVCSVYGQIIVIKLSQMLNTVAEDLKPGHHDPLSAHDPAREERAEMIAIIKAYFERFGEYEDMGPRGETWQSAEMIELTDRARAIIAKAEQRSVTDGGTVDGDVSEEAQEALRAFAKRHGP